ncbi:glycylpeptide N-tetradecanoyltransferase NMT1 [Pneumocystis jirovecii RU7]|uniref:Glycylpeptide N-tetradecanoyltransferase n=1 Tax=Pneumocystis jirovecii (strain RU7) TaxID=1408657 RepID=A0A0W4ZDY4_PNEJ7|nr:glycylpeptide N-tetradecanoyltransferase NMT1 [Pneumocystis jirovecii RU7]KTW26592.1 hypothetical protein T551_03509 [Pneumocystis jirovecii RU7]
MDSINDTFYHKDQRLLQKQRKCKSFQRSWNTEVICLNTSNELDLTRNLEKKNENYCVNTEKLPVVEKTMKENEIHELLNELSLKPARKKMSDYKFWNTQPVCSFDEEISEEGPIDDSKDLEKVRKEPYPLLKEFEWVTLDVDDEEDLKNLYQLLAKNYVEDDDSMFRFDYSELFLKWAIKPPGFHKNWHIGVRVAASKKLVAFVSGIPISLRVKDRVIKCSEINFLCIHKKLRSKRLTPILIKEITRRCNLSGTWQAIYTAGVILPSPISSCQYYHRSLNWQKLYTVGFSPLPKNSTIARQIQKFKLPNETSTPGLRPITVHDLEQVSELLRSFLKKFELSQIFSNDEVKHWLIPRENQNDEEATIFSYVIENPSTGKITDFFSFYSLPSNIITDTKYKTLNAAYLFYYALESGIKKDMNQTEHKIYIDRLNLIMKDCLIIAKNKKFDVFNALTLMDNPFFLENQKFGPGDGKLNYYLFNYRSKYINPGITRTGKLDVENGSSIAVVML